jgi:hypothetical protein
LEIDRARNSGRILPNFISVMGFWDPIRAVLTAGAAMEVDDATALTALEVAVDAPPRRVEAVLDDEDVVTTPPRRAEVLLEGGEAVVDTRRVEEDEEGLVGGVTRRGGHLPLILSLILQNRLLRSLAAGVGVGVGRAVVRPTPRVAAYAKWSVVNKVV